MRKLDRGSYLMQPVPGRKFLEWEGSTTPRRWVPFCGLTPRFVREPRSGTPIHGEAPMEPPIGFGSTYRSIFPESQLERTAAPCSGPVGKKKADRYLCS